MAKLKVGNPNIVMKIYLTNSNVVGASYRPRQDLYTNIYSAKSFVERKHKIT